MGNAIPKIDAWIWRTLTADPVVQAYVGNRVFKDLAPEKSLYPLVIFQATPDAENVQGVGTGRVQARVVYLVKLVEVGAVSDEGIAVADKIDVLLGQATRETLNGYVFESRCVRPFAAQGLQSGIRYSQTGGFFRVDTWEAS